MLYAKGVQARSSSAAPKAGLAPADGWCWLWKEPRHARGIAALAAVGTQSCQSPGLGPRRILPLEGLPSPAAGSLTLPAQLQQLLLKLSGTGMLQPHHRPGFPPARSPSKPGSPQGGQCHTEGTFPRHPFKPTTLAHSTGLLLQKGRPTSGQMLLGPVGALWLTALPEDPQGAPCSEQHVTKVLAGGKQSPPPIPNQHRSRSRAQQLHPARCDLANPGGPQDLLRRWESPPRPWFIPLGQ